MKPNSPICRFCARNQSAASIYPIDVWDIPLVRSDNFTVMPTKGPLVEGWLLIIPNEHILALASTSHADELDELIATLTETLTKSYASPTLFEHGAAVPGSSFGCGIDHAHLHMVPLGFDLENLTRELLPEIVWHDSTAPWKDQASEHRPYLALREPNRSWRRSTPADLPRQFFRRVIAKAVQLDAAYDYDTHPRHDLVAQTYARITSPQT